MSNTELIANLRRLNDPATGADSIETADAVKWIDDAADALESAEAALAWVRRSVEGRECIEDDTDVKFILDNIEAALGRHDGESESVDAHYKRLIAKSDDIPRSLLRADIDRMQERLKP